MNPIYTPYGVAPAEAAPAPDVQAQLRALCGDMALIEADVSRLTAIVDSVLRRLTVLERRELARRRRRGAPR
jgi:hypothetical protein